jgi:hypothetical protein
MQTEHIVVLLVAERDRLNRAIEALQEPLKRRGRPPKNASATAASAPAAAPKGKRKRRSAAQRRAQSEKMKAYWAQRKKQKSKG